MNQPNDRLHQLSENLLACLDCAALVHYLPSEVIERTYQALPEDFSDELLLYTINRERLLENLDATAAEDITESDLTHASIVLGVEYLKRIHFLLRYEDTPSGMRWAINPLHDIPATLKKLEAKNPGLFRLAQFTVEHENPQMEVSSIWSRRRGCPLLITTHQK